MSKPLYTEKALRRFWSNTARVENGCVEWSASCSKKGYGQFSYGTSMWRAHRWILQAHTGRKLEPFEYALHRCDNPPCVNLAHLRLGTQVDNMKDMHERDRANNWNAAKTHCPEGHELSGNNLKLWEWNTHGWRVCRVCSNTRDRKR